MADQFSFDVVSHVDLQEVKNAVEHTTKEVRQRFDFKGSKTELTLNEKEKQLTVLSDDEYKLNAVLDILKAKCVKRNVSVKALTFGKLEEALGGTVRPSLLVPDRGRPAGAGAVARNAKRFHDLLARSLPRLRVNG